MSSLWTPVGVTDPKSLIAERLQLHYGAWILSSVAHSRLPAREDDSHSNLGLEGPGRAFSTRSLDDRGALVLELVISNLTLAFRDGVTTLASLPLAAKTRDEALAWAGGVAEETWPTGPAVRLRLYADFPDADLARGGRFTVGDQVRRAELGRWFANGQAALATLIADTPTASPLRVWPHHFDLGTLIDLGQGRSIGAGLSPGDANYDEPYFYVYPYPAPEPALFGALQAEIGDWTTIGFTGALLRATEILSSSDPARATASFLAEALARCRAVLG